MGIKHFFYWLKQKFPDCMFNMERSSNFIKAGINNMDNVIIDMNGIIHNSAQKVFEYGKYKPIQRLTRSVNLSTSNVNNTRVTRPSKDLEIQVYQDVCNTIDDWVRVTQPRKNLVLCIDGPAPMSKQNQQRQRRFKSSLEQGDSAGFDSCSITPGTKFMFNLGKYMDFYIRSKITSDPEWRKFNTIFSSSTVCGEGEHKGIEFIRKNNKPNQSYCIIGNDADLIMLALATHMPNMYVLREDMYNDDTLFCVNVGKLSNLLSKELRWVSDSFSFVQRQAVNDFVFLCFFVGNDFLPHIPTIEIAENGIEIIFEVYRHTCINHGHITYQSNGKTLFDLPAFGAFLTGISQYEKESIENKVNKKECIFPDKLMLGACKQDDTTGQLVVNLTKYISDYWTSKFGQLDHETVCREYLEGMQWVLSYYTTGVPHWKWFYSHHYAPPVSILAQNVLSYKHKKYPPSTPSFPFEQLLRVLPPKSAGLLPPVLGDLLVNPKSPLVKYCPTEIVLDMDGMRREWEAVVLVCNMDEQAMLKEYNSKKSLLTKSDLARNIQTRPVLYQCTNDPYNFITSFGTIKNCTVNSIEI